MRDAYLIIAHNEFEVLQLLLSALDNAQNDIYIHFDKKVRQLPELTTKYSNLYVLDKRVDVRWGHVTQIKTEMLLFATAAKNGPYRFYHLISGTHLPLKDSNGLNVYFQSRSGNSVVTGLTKDTPYQETLKMHRINLFLRNYASKSKFLSGISQFLWKSIIAIQRWLHIEINKSEDFWKSSNWVSLSEDAVRYLVSRKQLILRKYRYSLCGDEFFVASELMQSPLRNKIYDEELYLKCDMQRANPRTYSLDELPVLKETGYLFARKFTSR